jgi:hypothetical protein
MKKLLCCLCLCLAAALSHAQDTNIFALPLQMDDVVIKAARGGWDVAGFIRRVQTDTTFYKAFRALRLVSYKATNDIRILNKKNEVSASLFSHTRQTAVRGCRTMQVLDEQVTGDFYTRRKGYNYYTAELYAYLFFTKGTICNENDIVAGALDDRGKGTIEKSKWQLKQLIFNPGGRIRGIPFIGNKASIFDPEIAKLYDFKLLSVAYAGEECWLFRAIPKPEYLNKVVYNELSTWFRKSDYSIMARDYALSFSAGVYDFDVRMKVRLQPAGGRLLPSRIEYDGNWHVFTKPRERARFTATFEY